MFAEAIRTLSPTVHAFIETVKIKDPKRDPVTGSATFIVLNEEGWILTAAHIIDLYVKAQADIAAQQAYDEEVKRVSALPKLTPKQKIQLLEPLQKQLGQPTTIIAHTWMTSFGLENGPTTIEFPAVYKPTDLAVGRLVGFDKSLVPEYPIFRNPDKPVEIGEPVCRLGFPFTEAPTKYDSKTKKFDVPHISLSRFPNDGIVTRFVLAAPFDENVPPVMWLETSTPGIRGQSGGPIFDVNGHICAVQSHTIPLPLDFGSTNQYLNVGRGAYVSEIIALLGDQGVGFRLSE
jgi:hypothetical protein